METSYHLKVQSGPETGQDFLLEKTEIILGRDPGSDIAIADPEVSRRHARLMLEGQHYSIEDLGSTNGTFVQGNPIHGLASLKSGEIIAIGERVVLLYEETVFDPDATMAVPRRLESGSNMTAASVDSPAAEPLKPAVTPNFSKPVENPIESSQINADVPLFAESQPELPALPDLVIDFDENEDVSSSMIGQVPVQPPAEKKHGPWRGIILIVVLLILIFLVIPWIIIDITSSYCLFLPGILNAIQPGVCP